MTRCALLLLLVACKTSHSAESDTHIAGKLDTGATDTEHAQASGETKQGPETITTTVEEYAPFGAVEVPPQSLDGAAKVPAEQEGYPASHNPDPSSSATVRPRPILVKRTVTVTQRGGIDTTWQASSDGLAGTETHVVLDAAQDTKTASSMAPAGILGGLLALWPLILGALVFGGGVLLWHLKPPWLGWLWKLIGRSA